MRPRPSRLEISPNGEASKSRAEGRRSLSWPATSLRSLATVKGSEAPEPPSEAPDFAASLSVADGVAAAFVGMRWIDSPSGAHAQAASSASDATAKITERIS